MKRGIVAILAVLAFSLILAAGCMSTSPTGTTGTPTVSATTSAATVGGNLPNQSEIAVLTNGTYAVNVSLEQISIDKSDSGAHTVDIYVNAKNAGKDPVTLHWYSRITGADGVSFGGVGVSHDGSGAETGSLGNNGASETARDYVVIDSDKEYAALSQGAVLEVFITTEPNGAESPVSFTAAWSLNPALFT